MSKPPTIRAPNMLLRTGQDEGCVATDLERLCCLLEAKTLDAIDWYLRRKRKPKLWSQWLRALAIITGILGGLIPVIGVNMKTGNMVLYNLHRSTACCSDYGNAVCHCLNEDSSERLGICGMY